MVEGPVDEQRVFVAAVGLDHGVQFGFVDAVVVDFVPFRPRGH